MGKITVRRSRALIILLLGMKGVNGFTHLVETSLYLLIVVLLILLAVVSFIDCLVFILLNHQCTEIWDNSMVGNVLGKQFDIGTSVSL